MIRSRLCLEVVHVLSLLALVLWPGRGASAAELTASVSGASPETVWTRGYGATFTISLFSLVHGEIEGVRQGGEALDTNLLTLSGKAYLGPTIGRVVPYVGLGTGVYVEGRPGDDDTGTLGSFFVGTKLKVSLGFLLRAEVQWLALPSGIPLPLDRRVLVGAGLSF